MMNNIELQQALIKIARANNIEPSNMATTNLGCFVKAVKRQERLAKFETLKNPSKKEVYNYRFQLMQYKLFQKGRFTDDELKILRVTLEDDINVKGRER